MSTSSSHMTSRCFNCAERGHMSKTCPKPKSIMCYNCQENGHMTNTCPIGKFCHACGDRNHLVSVCPVRGPVCYKCGINGHLARQCKDADATTDSIMSSLMSALSDDVIANASRCCYSCGKCTHSDMCCQLEQSH